MQASDFSLDEEAQKLFQNIGGIDARKKTGLSTAGRTMMAERLLQEQERFDSIRLDVARLVWILGRSIRGEVLHGKGTTRQTLADEIARLCKRLQKSVIRKKNLLIRYKGRLSDQTREVSEYEILFGDLLLDPKVARDIIKRQTNQAADLPAHIESAFAIFDQRQISSLLIRLPDNARQFKMLWDSLGIIAQYNNAIRNGHSISLMRAKQPFSFPPTPDETGKPDPNLSLVAGLNGLSPGAMGALVAKIDALLKQSRQKASSHHHLGVYDALFKLKKLKGKLLHPPIEVNNIRWLMIDDEKEKITREKAHVAHLAFDNAGGHHTKTARILKSVYGKDFAKIDSHEVAERLKLSSDLLDTIEKKKSGEKVEKEVMTNVEERLDQVNDEVYDNLFVAGNQVKVVTSKQGTFMGKVHARLTKLVGFYKKRSKTKRKMKAIVNRVVDFDHQDYHTLAKDFAITVEEANELVDLLKSCFDSQGNFQKSVFTKIVPDFARYERRIFEFLWHYLKEAIHQTDRTAFINSLQLLVARLKQPKSAIKTVLDDLSKNAAKVKFADRKAFMLCNLLVRKYNHELVNYQFTPENILNVEEGLNRSVVSYAAWKIEQNREKINEKVATVHKRLLGALDAKDSGSPLMNVPYLIGLEREAMIFFALIGGDTAKSMIFTALDEYSNAQSKIYHLNQSQAHLADLLNITKVLVRGMGRIAQAKDAGLLEVARRNIEGFTGMIASVHHEDLVNQILEWTERAGNQLN